MLEKMLGISYLLKPFGLEGTVDQYAAYYANSIGAKNSYNAPYYLGNACLTATMAAGSFLKEGVVRLLPSGAQKSIDAVTGAVSNGAEQFSNRIDHVATRLLFDSTPEAANAMSGQFFASETIFPALWFGACAMTTWKLVQATKKNWTLLLTNQRNHIDFVDVNPHGSQSKSDKITFVRTTQASNASVAIGTILVPAAAAITSYATFLAGKGIYDRLKDVGASPNAYVAVLLAPLALPYVASSVGRLCAKGANAAYSAVTNKPAPITGYPKISTEKFTEKHKMDHKAHFERYDQLLPNFQIGAKKSADVAASA